MRSLLGAAGVAVGTGSAALALGMALGIASGHADPGANNSTFNVVGEPYAKAVAILRAQGVPSTFGGSVGSDVPQSQCIVKSQKVLTGQKMQLNLDCTAEAQPQRPAATPVATVPGAQATAAEGARPTAGAPGVVTVIPTPVG